MIFSAAVAGGSIYLNDHSFTPALITRYKRRNSKMKNLTLLLLLCLACLVAGANGQAKPSSTTRPPDKAEAFETLKIGTSTTIKIPAIDGLMHAVSDGSPATERVKPRLSGMIEVLSIYLSPDDLKTVHEVPPTIWSSYAMFSTNAPEQNNSLSSSVYDQYASQMTDGLEPMFDANGKSLENARKGLHAIFDQNAGDVAPGALGELKKVGIFNKSSNMFWVLLTQSGVSANGEKVTYILTGSSIYIKDRELLLHIYRRYKTDADIDLLGSLTNKWVTAIIAANK